MRRAALRRAPPAGEAHPQTQGADPDSGAWRPHGAPRSTHPCNGTARLSAGGALRREHPRHARRRSRGAGAYFPRSVRRHACALDAAPGARGRHPRGRREGHPHRRRARCGPYGGNPPERRRSLAAQHRARSPPMTRPGAAGTLIWALLVIIAAGIAARATYTADLSAFLPRNPSATQRLLFEQLRPAPAARLILVALEGADARTRARLSVQLARELRSDPHFIAVNNGDAASLERDREFLFRHRYLLSETVTPQRFTVAGLHAAIADSLDVLASPEGALLQPLFPRDPTGEMLGILEALGPGRGPRTTEGVWSSRDGARALLIVQTRAAGSDTDAQQAACQAIRRAFDSSLATIPATDRRGTALLMGGAPVFA